MPRSHPPPELPPSEYQPLWTLVLRLLWLAIGPATLILLIASMISNPHPGLATGDAIYTAVTVLTIVLRWIDFYLGEPRFPMDTRSTQSQVRNHSIIVAVAAAASWIAVRLWGGFFVR